MSEFNWDAIPKGKPDWSVHNWPRIFHHPDGYWFGVKAGWELEKHIFEAWKGTEVSLLSEDGHWLSHDSDTSDWRNSQEDRPT